jgi:polynucleotide 5'-hydroxyl-kinase GRC3/NOL9
MNANASSIGPAFTHPTVPVASHFLGTTSPAANPSSYLSAITSLLSTYSLEVEYPLVDDLPRSRHHQSLDRSSQKIKDRVPLVINTQGWVKGLGADLLDKLKGLSKPTHIFLFEAPNWEEGESRDGGWNESDARINSGRDRGCEVIKMESAPASSLDSKWSAADLRTLSFVSYFHSIFPALSLSANLPPLTTLATTWDFSLPLISRRPYSVDWTKRVDGKKMIRGAYIIDGEVEFKEILHALNGTIVALVTSTSSFIPAEMPSLSNPFPYSLDAPLPCPSDSNCLGLALIRSIDPMSTSLHFITPLQTSILALPISLIRGSIELPLALVLDFNNTNNDVEQAKGLVGFEWKDVPYLSVEGTEAGGGGRKKVRKNLMRRGQN